jgi:hypothetical protein
MSGSVVAPDAGADEPNHADEIKRLQDEIQQQATESPDEAARRRLESRAEADRVRAEQAAAEAPEMAPAVARSSLELMLSSAPSATETDRYEIPRLTRRFGAPFVVELRNLSDTEFEELSERAQREPTLEEREQGVTIRPRDLNKFNLLVVAEAMVEPNLRDEALRSKWGPRPEDVVRRWFLVGEIQRLSGVVSNLSGWGDGAVVRAKK